MKKGQVQFPVSDICSLTNKLGYSHKAKSPKLSRRLHPPPFERFTTYACKIMGSEQQIQRETDIAETTDGSVIKETIKVKLSYNSVSKVQLLNNYEILRELGVGNHSKVKKGYDIHASRFVAVKILDKTKKKKHPHSRLSHQSTLNTRSDNNIGLIRNEIKIHKRISRHSHHRNVIRLFEILNDKEAKKIYLILEFCPLGEIRWWPPSTTEISSSGPGQFIFQRCREMFLDVVAGLEFLHSLKIVHRDIKPSNLLLDENGTVKISDFGVSIILPCPLTTLNKTVGTPAFFSPEICLGDDFWEELNVDERVDRTAVLNDVIPYKFDVWSLGISLYCILFGRLPFNSRFELKLFDMIINDAVQFPEYTEELGTTQVTSEEEFELAKNLIEHLLTKNPLKRFSIEEIKEHPFVLLGESHQCYGNNDSRSDSLSVRSRNPDLVRVASKKPAFTNDGSDFAGDDDEFVELPLNSSFASLDSFYMENFALTSLQQGNTPDVGSPDLKSNDALKRSTMKKSVSSNLMMTPLNGTKSSSISTTNGAKVTPKNRRVPVSPAPSPLQNSFTRMDASSPSDERKVNSFSSNGSYLSESGTQRSTTPGAGQSFSSLKFIKHMTALHSDHSGRDIRVKRGNFFQNFSDSSSSSSSSSGSLSSFASDLGPNNDRDQQRHTQFSDTVDNIRSRPQNNDAVFLDGVYTPPPASAMIQTGMHTLNTLSSTGATAGSHDISLRLSENMIGSPPDGMVDPLQSTSTIERPVRVKRRPRLLAPESPHLGSGMSSGSESDLENDKDVFVLQVRNRRQVGRGRRRAEQNQGTS